MPMGLGGAGKSALLQGSLASDECEQREVAEEAQRKLLSLRAK